MQHGHHGTHQATVAHGYYGGIMAPAIAHREATNLSPCEAAILLRSRDYTIHPFSQSHCRADPKREGETARCQGRDMTDATK